jgi:hypothetical protein
MKQFSRVVAVIILGVFSSAGQVNVVSPVRQYRQANEHRLLTEYFKLLAIPNVASESPNIRKNADYLVTEMQKRGLKPRLLEAQDSRVPPVVFGEWNTPGATKTVIFYAHYDGQPTDPKQWTGSEPWVPILRSNATEKRRERSAVAGRGRRRSTLNGGSMHVRRRMIRQVCLRYSPRSTR